MEEIETDYWAAQALNDPADVRYEDEEFDLEAMVELVNSDDWETLIEQR